MHRDTACLQPVRIGYPFVMQAVKFFRFDIRRRKIMQLLLAGWRCIVLHPVIRIFQVEPPHPFRQPGVPNGAVRIFSHRIRPHTRIQHRIDQHLKADLTHSLLSVPQRTGGGQRASGAVSSYRDARSINACFPACLDVFQTGTAIQEGNRKRILV